MPVCTPEQTYWAVAIGGLWLADSVLEYWLGRTKKVQASSKWELIGGVLVLASAWVIQRKTTKEEKQDGKSRS